MIFRFGFFSRRTAGGLQALTHRKSAKDKRGKKLLFHKIDWDWVVPVIKDLKRLSCISDNVTRMDPIDGFLGFGPAWPVREGLVSNHRPNKK